MNTVYIGIGTNLGNREENIAKAIEKIKEESKIIKESSIYETEPVGITDQPLFLNSVIQIETQKPAKELFHFLKTIEKELGRKETIKNGPRIIDLDILFFNNEVIETEQLTIPHPRLHERVFVLEPLMEINLELFHPKLKKTIEELNSIQKKVLRH